MCVISSRIRVRGDLARICSYAFSLVAFSVQTILVYHQKLHPDKCPAEWESERVRALSLLQDSFHFRFSAPYFQCMKFFLISAAFYCVAFRRLCFCERCIFICGSQYPSPKWNTLNNKWVFALVIYLVQQVNESQGFFMRSAHTFIPSLPLSLLASWMHRAFHRLWLQSAHCSSLSPATIVRSRSCSIVSHHIQNGCNQLHQIRVKWIIIVRCRHRPLCVFVVFSIRERYCVRSRRNKMKWKKKQCRSETSV